MERITIPDKKIDGGECRAVIDARKVKERAMTIYWALKKYEDIGLTPEQIMELKERDTAKVPEIHKNERSNVYKCPNCNLAFIYKNETGWFSGRHYKFCPDCGQRMKWEEKRKWNMDAMERRLRLN